MNILCIVLKPREHLPFSRADSDDEVTVMSLDEDELKYDYADEIESYEST